MALRPPVQHPARGPAIALMVAMAIGLSALPIPSGPPSSSVTVPAAGASLATGGVRPLGTVSPQTIVPVGPTAARLLDVRTSLPIGTSNSVTALDVDPATGEVFAANEFAATVTVFNESTGAVLRVQGVGSFTGGAYPAGLLLDPTHHRLFVSISTRYSDPSGGGWMLVLNESTLATEGNVTFSVAPVPPFEPTFIAYDAPTDQAFVENATGGEIAVVDLGLGAVSKYLACPVADCAEHGYGLVNIPAFHTLVVPTCAPSLWLVNTTNDSTRALLAGPALGALMAWAAFDSVDQTLWVENYSYFGSLGTFLEYNLSTLGLLADVPGAPPRETGMVYEPMHNLLVATNINGSKEIATFRASDASPVAVSGTASGTSNPFLTLAVDPVTGVAIAGGPGNGSTVAYRLPSLTIDRVYSSFPLAQTAAAADPSRGSYIVTSLSPTAVRSENATTGALNWETLLPGPSDPVGVVVDNATSIVFVADASSGDLLAYDAANGLPSGTFPTGAAPSGICALIDDPGRGLLYVGVTQPAEVLSFSVAQAQISGTLPLTGESPCRLALDPANHDLIVLSTSVNAGVYDLTPQASGALVQNASWTAPAAPVDVAVDGSGTVYVLEGSGTELLAADAFNGTVLGVRSLAATPASALAIDRTDQFLFLAELHTGAVDVIGTAGFPSLAKVVGPSPAGALAFDEASGTLIAPTAATGQMTIAVLVPVPSSPTALAVLSGNHSFSASWGPPVSAGADPVVGYQYEVMSGPSGYLPVNLTGSSAAIQNLTNGVPYGFAVAAVSAAGVGTSLARATVVPAGVPFPPTGLTALSHSSSSVTLSWSPPASDDGAAIQDYRVFYGSSGTVLATAADAGTSTNTTITGLSSATNYSFEVVAANSVGLGHPSGPISASTDAASGWTLVEFTLAGGIVVIVLAALVALVWIRRRRKTRSSDIPDEPPTPGA